MTPAIITLEDHVSGDTWQGIPVIGPIQIQSGETLVNFPYPIASARLNLTKLGACTPSLTLATNGSPMAPIDFVDVDTWEMEIPPVPAEVWTPTPGQYQGHFETTDTNGTVLTIYDVRFNVLPDKTK